MIKFYGIRAYEFSCFFKKENLLNNHKDYIVFRIFEGIVQLCEALIQQKGDNMDAQRLKNSIWKTRKSRINAEHRLLNKSQFIQFVNVYYSLHIIVFSIFSMHKHDILFNQINFIMSVSLLVSILFLSSLKMEERAVDYRRNYTELHKLENRINKDTIESELKSISDDYCELLSTASNHIPFDFMCVLKSMDRDEQKSHNFKCKHYVWEVTWRLLIKLIVISIPFLAYISFVGNRL